VPAASLPEGAEQLLEQVEEEQAQIGTQTPPSEKPSDDVEDSPAEDVTTAVQKLLQENNPADDDKAQDEKSPQADPQHTKLLQEDHPVDDVTKAVQAFKLMTNQEPSMTGEGYSKAETSRHSPKQSFGTAGPGLSSVTPHRHVEPAPVAMVAHDLDGADGDITSVRPGAGTGAADVVTFGVFAKAFYGADLKGNKWTLDSVVALKWTDPRVVGAVPAGLEKVSMSEKQALGSIWMPEVVITNRAIKKFEQISSTVIVHNTGLVEKIERALVTCNNIYELEQYPFDTQSLKVKIASSKYMLNELKLSPEKSMSGLRKGIFESFPYELDSWKVFEFEEKDGALQKSRGVLEILAERSMDKYWENHLMPTSLLLMISWGVFWFPFAQPFITPRLALSILALLAFTNIMIKSNGELPDGAPLNWNDILNQQIQVLMSCTIILNILSEIFKHHYKLDDLAQAINHEAKVVQPIMSISVIVVVLTAGEHKWLSVSSAGILTKIMIGTSMASYIGLCMAKLPGALAEKKRKADEAAKA